MANPQHDDPAQHDLNSAFQELGVSEDTPLPELVSLMEKNKIKRVPVVRDGKLVGIVTRASLLQAVANLAREVPDPTADDDHMRWYLRRN
jgi:predicted transcriptional regulator